MEEGLDEGLVGWTGEASRIGVCCYSAGEEEGRGEGGGKRARVAEETFTFMKKLNVGAGCCTCTRLIRVLKSEIVWGTTWHNSCYSSGGAPFFSPKIQKAGNQQPF